MPSAPIATSSERRECPSCRVLYQRGLVACPNCGDNHERAGGESAGERRFVPGSKKPPPQADDEA